MAIPRTDISSQGRIESFNPATGETLGSLPAATVAQVQAAVARARAVQPAWGEMSARERAAVLYRLRDLVIERLDEIARTDSTETGKPLTEAIGVIAGVADILTYYAKMAVRLQGGTRVSIGR
jgi:acyl-CoA reductase-like NAD-dependent aldehyde dehydrogenase